MKRVVKKYHGFSPAAQGVVCMVLSCFFASIMMALVRHLSAQFHIFFIVMVRNFFGLVFFLPQILKDYKHVLYTNKLGLHIFRGVNGLMSMFAWFYAITLMPLSEAVSISFIIPILTTLIAVFFLKEKFSKHNLLGSLVGFVGIMIILRPGFREFNSAYFYSFASVTLWVISNIVIKVMTKTEKPQTIVTYMSFVMLICSIPFAFPYMKPIDLSSFFWFALLGLTSNLTHIFISLAYGKTELSTVQPFDFTRLIFTSIISYFIFDEIIDLWVVLGSLVILFGVILVMPNRKFAEPVKNFGKRILKNVRAI